MDTEQWKAAAMADAQKVCDLTDLTTELADALEEAYWDRAGWVEKAKAALKKAGR